MTRLTSTIQHILGNWCLAAGISLLLSGCGEPPPEPFTPAACTTEWFAYLEQELGTGDGMGHGPDIGSGEWRSVIEFKLGIRDDPAVPDTQSPKWCDYINELMDERAASAE